MPVNVVTPEELQAVEDRINARIDALHPPASAVKRWYADSSFFNKLPAGPVHPDSARIIAKIRSWGNPINLLPGNAGNATWKDFGSPRYFASSTDPVFEIRQDSLGYPGSNWGTSIRIPQAALPATGSDVHLTVVAPDGLMESSFYRLGSVFTSNGAPISASNPLPDGGGILYAGGFGKYATDGSGLPIAYAGGGDKWTAGGQGGLSGDITPDELRNREIPHALRIAVKSTGKTFDADGFVAPALGTAGMSDPTDAPPNGARLRLNMTDDEIGALSVGESSKTMLRAMAKRGMYVMDTGGGGTWMPYIQSTYAEKIHTGIDPWITYAEEIGAGEGWVKDASGVYVWGDYRTATLPGTTTSIWSRLEVLDWRDAGNY